MTALLKKNVPQFIERFRELLTQKDPSYKIQSAGTEALVISPSQLGGKFIVSHALGKWKVTARKKDQFITREFLIDQQALDFIINYEEKS